jgi:hypothetical protein
MSEDDIRKKNAFLDVVRYDTSSVRDELIRVKDLVDKYNKDTKPENWRRIKDHAEYAMERLMEIRKYIHRHLNIIRYLVKNPRLDPDRFVNFYINYRGDLLSEACHIDAEYNQQGLANLMSNVEEPIGQLDGAFQFLDAEKAP